MRELISRGWRQSQAQYNCRAVRLRVAIPTIALVLASVGLQAQSPVYPEQSVLRLHWQDGGRSGVRLLTPLSHAVDSIHYCPYPAVPCTGLDDSRATSAAVSSILQVDYVSGSKWKQGALIGAAIGATTLLGLIALGGCDPDFTANDVGYCGMTIVLGTISSGLVGALIGGGVDRWSPTRW